MSRHHRGAKAEAVLQGLQAHKHAAQRPVIPRQLELKVDVGMELLGSPATP